MNFQTIHTDFDRQSDAELLDTITDLEALLERAGEAYLRRRNEAGEREQAAARMTVADVA